MSNSARVAKLETFFRRCGKETARNPKKALDLVLRAPDLVEAEKEALGANYENYLVRGLGLAGVALTMAGHRRLAISVYRECARIEASPSEAATILRCRSLHELYGSNWSEARALADEAVSIHEAGALSLRDDCSLSAALAMRGIVEGYAYQEGVEGFERERATDFFARALEVSEPGYQMSRLAALSGLGRVLVSGWLGAATPTFTDVAGLVRMLSSIRADLRREGTPYRSLLDANLRWLLALVLHRLFGGLGEGAERYFLDARDVLSEVGNPSVDVLWITLDYQWCLVADGRFASALKECEVLRGVGMDGALLDKWSHALKNRLVTDRIARRVFERARGSRGVRSPQGYSGAVEGWNLEGVGIGGIRGAGHYGF